MNKKKNQRYQDMNIYMKAALLELMKENEFEKITVKCICERAGVNRGTFYAHYTDIYSMLNDAEAYLSSELLRVMDEEARGADTPDPVLLVYLRYLREHRYACRIFLKSRNRLPIRATIQPLWERLAPQRYQRVGLAHDALLYVYLAFEGSMMKVLRHWIETDCREKEEELSEILKDCLPGLRSKDS